VSVLSPNDTHAGTRRLSANAAGQQRPRLCRGRALSARGDAWMFRTRDLVVYRFCSTRSGDIAKEILGRNPLPGVLVTDRYGGYNDIMMARQFCYSHLLRDLQDIEKEFPEVAEVKHFVASLAPLLSAAMGLRREAKDCSTSRRRAHRLMARIKQIIDCSANHPAHPLRNATSVPHSSRRTPRHNRQNVRPDPRPTPAVPQLLQIRS
jgi:hypothetical protein